MLKRKEYWTRINPWIVEQVVVETGGMRGGKKKIDHREPNVNGRKVSWEYSLLKVW